MESSNSAAEAMEDFILGMAMKAVESSFEGIVPFSFWLAAETSCISEELRAACKSVFMDLQDVIKKRLLEEGVEGNTAADKASVVVSLFEGALLQTLTLRDEQPLLAAAKIIPAILG